MAESAPARVSNIQRLADWRCVMPNAGIPRSVTRSGTQVGSSGRWRTRSVRGSAATIATALGLLLALTACSGTPASTVVVSAAPSATGSSSAATTAQEPTASQVALLYMDAFRGDLTGLKAYNPNTAATGTSFDGINQATLKSLGVTLNDEQNQLVADGTKAGLATVETKVVKETVNGNTATVTLAIRGIDLAKSYQQHVGAIDKTKLTEANKAATYAKALATSWAEAPLVAKASDVDMILNYPPGVESGGKWVPDPANGKAVANAFVKTS